MAKAYKRRIGGIIPSMYVHKVHTYVPRVDTFSAFFAHTKYNCNKCYPVRYYFSLLRLAAMEVNNGADNYVIDNHLYVQRNGIHHLRRLRYYFPNRRLLSQLRLHSYTSIVSRSRSKIWFRCSHSLIQKYEMSFEIHVFCFSSGFKPCVYGQIE